MESLIDAAIYIIPSLVICDIYNKINKKVIFNKEDKKISYLCVGIFILTTIYLSTILSILISPTHGFSYTMNWSNNLNLNPSRIITILYEKPINLLKNIIMFIPIGFFVPILCKKINNYIKIIFCGIVISTFIELFQLFLFIGTDIVHVITGTIGILIGYILYGILKHFKLYRNILNRASIYDNVKSLFIYFILIFICVISSGFYINFEKANDIEASNAYLVDVDDKNIIYSKQPHEKIAPASTTKMITALTVLDYCDINELVTIGDEIEYVYKDASTAGLKKGNVLTVKQLLEALLLPSGNDAAYALAKYAGEKICHSNSSEDALEDFMVSANKKAKSLGAYDSNFVRPDGYDTKGQYTTAKDLASIGEAFLQCEILSDISSKYKLEDVLTDGSEVTYKNTNELINPYSEYYYSNIKGLKTGSSSNAGKCVVSAADIDNKTYICVVMGSSDKGRWLDSLCLYQSIK